MKVTVVVSCVYGEQQERGGEGREEDEVGEGPGHWSTLLQRQRAFLLSFLSFSIFIVVALEAGCGVWSMMWQTTRIRGKRWTRRS